MFISGKDKLPDTNEVMDKLFKRKKFIPDELGTSVLLAFMAQHFTHQFFKTNFTAGAGYTFGEQAVSCFFILLIYFLKKMYRLPLECKPFPK